MLILAERPSWASHPPTEATRFSSYLLEAPLEASKPSFCLEAPSHACGISKEYLYDSGL